MKLPHVSHCRALLCRWALALFVVAVVAASAARSQEPARPVDGGATGRFLRVVRNEEGVVTALETAIARYTAPRRPGVVVDLIGAVHVAEKEYYQELNRRFAGYDAVLYELVSSPDTRPEPGRRSAHPVSAMQTGLQSLLDLEFQLDSIDYSAKNLVHADLSPEEFAQSMARGGESVLQMFFRLMGQSIAVQSQEPARASDLRLLGSFFSPNRTQQWKRIMAEEFELLLGVPSVLGGPDGSTIITVRNRRAMDVLAQQLDRHRRIAVFYGAAHMPDMEHQLRARFQFELEETTWLAAWAMP